jgi:hypothetical protein
MGATISAAALSTPVAGRAGQRLLADASYAVCAEALVRDFDGLRAVDDATLRVRCQRTAQRLSSPRSHHTSTAALRAGPPLGVGA